MGCARSRANNTPLPNKGQQKGGGSTPSTPLVRDSNSPGSARGSLLDLFPSREAGRFGRRRKHARGARVPVTVVTGLLGAGKTTLVRRFLATPEGKAARLKYTSQADYGPTSDNALAKKLYSGAVEVAWDRPDNMAAREALFGRAAAILTGQTR